MASLHVGYELTVSRFLWPFAGLVFVKRKVMATWRPSVFMDGLAQTKEEVKNKHTYRPATISYTNHAALPAI
jgi:hypothetical protein